MHRIYSIICRLLNPAFLGLFFSIHLINSTANASSIEGFSGYHLSQHGYLNDNAQLSGLIFGASLNMQKQKLKHRKWLSRGPRASIIQSTNMLDLVGDAHLYQITRSQSVWFHAQRTTQTLQATLSGNETFLDQSGNSLALTSGTQVDSERTFQRYSVYWYESLREEGPINRASLFYQLEFSPAASELSNNTATLYDGDFRGFGFSLGRIKDDRGLNFQWRMYFAQLETDFSNNATAHRSLNSAESQVYQLAGKLQWHYRYRLAPYWYVVPYVKIDFSAMLQGKSEPDNVEHDVLTYSSMSSWISLQKKF